MKTITLTIPHLRQLICLMFLLPLYSLAEFETLDCSQVPTNHQKLVEKIKTSCESADQCQISSIKWDICFPNIVHSDPEFAQQLIESRKELHKICNYVPNPCHFDSHKEREQIGCLNHKCQRLSALKSIDLKNLQFRFKVQDQILAHKKVELNIDTGIRCVTVPCPSSKTLKVFTTDINGQILLPISIFQSLLSPENPSSEGASWLIPGVGYSQLDPMKILVNINEIHDVNF